MISQVHVKRWRNIGSLLAATALHAGVLALFAVSLRQELLSPPLQEDSPAISVGLAPASVLMSDRLPAATLAQEFQRDEVSQPQTTSTPASTDTSSLFAQMDGSRSPKSASAAPRARAAEAAAPKQSGPKLTADANPWTHAALAAVDGSKARQLWQVAQRCWHGGVSFTPSQIRIDLDGGGEVTSMAWLGDGDADARAQAEAVAAAISACAPYRAVAPSAGAYLVVGPLA